jgi:hypothetical protein
MCQQLSYFCVSCKRGVLTSEQTRNCHRENILHALPACAMNGTTPIQILGVMLQSIPYYQHAGQCSSSKGRNSSICISRGTSTSTATSEESGVMVARPDRWVQLKATRSGQRVGGRKSGGSFWVCPVADRRVALGCARHLFVPMGPLGCVGRLGDPRCPTQRTHFGGGLQEKGPGGRRVLVFKQLGAHPLQCPVAQLRLVTNTLQSESTRTTY